MAYGRREILKDLIAPVIRKHKRIVEGPFETELAEESIRRWLWDIP
jgi:hypothetical protein